MTPTAWTEKLGELRGANLSAFNAQGVDPWRPDCRLRQDLPRLQLLPALGDFLLARNCADIGVVFGADGEGTNGYEVGKSFGKGDCEGPDGEVQMA